MIEKEDAALADAGLVAITGAIWKPCNRFWSAGILSALCHSLV
jgi:hypothetical protein